MKKENREAQLAKNTVIVAIGKICTQFMSFFLLPLYTSLLSTSEYGTVDLLNTCISLIIPIFFFQMEQAIFRFLIDIRDDDDNKRKTISTCMITIFIQMLLYIVVYFAFEKFINNDYKLFLATNVVASMMSSLLLQISRGLGDNMTYSLGSLISGAGTIICNVLFIAVFKWGAYGMLTASLIANILCALFVFIKKKIYRYINFKKYDKKILKTLWKYSIPLIPNQLSWWIVNVSDRLIITHFIGVSMNGIYSASNKFSSICITVFNIFNMTWSESASLHIKDKDSSDFFSKIINFSLNLFISLVFGIVAFMPLIFKFLITGEDYEAAYYQIPILMTATIFNVAVSLFGSVYVALKKSNEIAKTSIIAAIINIIINIIFIKYLGLYAASISTLVAYVAMSIYRYVDVKKYVRIKLDKRMIVCSIFTGIIIGIIYYIRNIWLNLFGIIIAVIFAIYFNKETILTIINFIKIKLKRMNNCESEEI